MANRDIEKTEDAEDRGQEPDPEMTPREMLTFGATVLAYRLGVLIACILGTIAVLRWGVAYVVERVVGTETTFDFSFAINISLVLNFVLTAALAFSELSRQRMQRRIAKRDKP